MHIAVLLEPDDRYFIRVLANMAAVLATERSDGTAAATVASRRERVHHLGVDRDHRQVDALLPGIARLAVVIKFPLRLVAMIERFARGWDIAFHQQPHHMLDWIVVLPANPSTHLPE